MIKPIIYLFIIIIIITTLHLGRVVLAMSETAERVNNNTWKKLLIW